METRNLWVVILLIILAAAIWIFDAVFFFSSL